MVGTPPRTTVLAVAHYYRCFGDVISLPELDTGNTHVQQHLVRAAQHWLTGYGVDGVRCDHVAGVDPAFWVELRRGLRRSIRMR